MHIYNKIQCTVLACAVAALGASVYVGAMETDFKQYSASLAQAGSVLAFSTTGLGLLFSRLLEKELHQSIGSAISKFTGEIDKPKNKSNL